MAAFGSVAVPRAGYLRDPRLGRTWSISLCRPAAATGRCAITPVCRLRGLLQNALQAYMQSLRAHTLGDLLHPGNELELILGIKHLAA